MIIDTETATANCRNSSPEMPGMKATGTKTDSSTSVMAMIGAVISPMARRAASAGESEGSSSIFASTASTTTMASSTTMPMASTSASSETVLAEKPIASITAKVPISETGTAISGMMVARSDAEEQEDHDDDEDEGLDQRLDHLVNALLDEHGGVVGDLVVDALRERLLRVVQHRRARASALAMRIAARRLVDADHRGRTAILAALLFGEPRRQLDAGHVAHAHERAVRIGAHHDVAELLHAESGGPWSGW